MLMCVSAKFSRGCRAAVPRDRAESAVNHARVETPTHARGFPIQGHSFIGLPVCIEYLLKKQVTDVHATELKVAIVQKVK